MRNWGQKYKQIREAKGLTQEKVADRAGTTRITVQAFELRGEARFSIVQSLIAALDITEGEFFESRVVSKYDNPKHQVLHEQLQEILDAGARWENGIEVNIESIHLNLRSQQAEEGRVQQAQGVESKKASPSTGGTHRKKSDL